MGTSPAPGVVIELSGGLSLVPCTVVSLSFVRTDVSVKPVDEWQLKVGLVAMFKKRFGLVVADRDLVVRKEKDYFKKRRDEPIADGTLHLWGGPAESAKARLEGADFGKHVVENINGVELSSGGLKLKCLAVVKETNELEALKRAWEVTSGPRRGGGAQGQGGPTTLTLRGVPSRWFAEPRVSSKPSVLVTHTIFSTFGEIRNLEVLSNEDPGSNSKDVGSMAAALQCQIWVQFDSHTNFCKALHAFCGRAMQKAGSNFRAMYVVDWDKENYFSVINVQKRKFEKERLERQVQTETESKLKEEMNARQAKLARAEVERLKGEKMAAALREEEGRSQHLTEQAKKMEEEFKKQVLHYDTSSEEEGLIQDERQDSSDDEMPRREKEIEGRRIEDDRFSPPRRLNGTLKEMSYLSEIEGELNLQQARGKGNHLSEDEEALPPSRTREKRRFLSEDSGEEEVPSAHGRRYTIEDRRGALSVRAKRGDTSQDEEVRHLKKRKDSSELESESESEERHVKKKRDTWEDETERSFPEIRGIRRYTSEDEEERQPLQSKEKRGFSSDEDEILPPAEKKVNINNHGRQNVHFPEDSAYQEMYNPLERWKPEEETMYYSKSSMQNITHEKHSPGPVKDRRMTSGKRSPSPLTTEEDEEESEDVEFVEREPGRWKEDDPRIERWVLDVTHSLASLSKSEIQLRVGWQTHKGGLAARKRPEKRLRSVIIISS